MATFEIRTYQPEVDNPRILAIAKNLGIPARVRLGIDRSPDFTAFDKMLGDPFQIFVASANEEILGFLEVCLPSFFLFGEQSTGMHLPLGGIRKEWRRKGVINALIEEAKAYGVRNGAKWGYTLVNAQNKKIQQYIKQFYAEITMLDRFLVQGIVYPLLPSIFFSSGYEIHALEDDQWDEFLAFFEENMEDKAFYPVIPTDLLRSLKTSSAIEIYLARDKSGRIAASLGTWDVSAAKRSVVIQYGKTEQWLLRPVNTLLALGKLAPFPKAGGSLHNLYSLLPLALPGQEAAFDQLLFYVRKKYREYNLVLTGIPNGDKRNRLMKKYLHFTNVNIPVLSGLTEEYEGLLKSKRPESYYLEYAFI